MARLNKPRGPETTTPSSSMKKQQHVANSTSNNEGHVGSKTSPIKRSDAELFLKGMHIIARALEDKRSLHKNLPTSSEDFKYRHELKPGSGLFISDNDHAIIEQLKRRPREMVRKLLKSLIGTQKLKEMSALGVGRKYKTCVPPVIRNAVLDFVNQTAELRLDTKEYYTVINQLCDGLRSARVSKKLESVDDKKREEKKTIFETKEPLTSSDPDDGKGDKADQGADEKRRTNENGRNDEERKREDEIRAKILGGKFGGGKRINETSDIRETSEKRRKISEERKGSDSKRRQEREKIVIGRRREDERERKRGDEKQRGRSDEREKRTTNEERWSKKRQGDEKEKCRTGGGGTKKSYENEKKRGNDEEREKSREKGEEKSEGGGRREKRYGEKVGYKGGKAGAEKERREMKFEYSMKDDKNGYPLIKCSYVFHNCSFHF